MRQICEAEGGAVSLDLDYASGSPHGPGARFVVDLPLRDAGPPPASSAEVAATPVAAPLVRGPYRVLVVDDDKLVRHMVGQLLTKRVFAHCRVDHADNGEGCLTMLAADGAYDVVVVDHVRAALILPAPPRDLPPRLT